MSRSTDAIDFSQDIISGQDILDRFEHLNEKAEQIAELKDSLASYRQELHDARSKLGTSNTITRPAIVIAIDLACEAMAGCETSLEEVEADFDDDERAELATLKELIDDVGESTLSDESLIADSYFVEAMQELCDDIGDVPKSLPSYVVIDWEATAKNLQADYSSVDVEIPDGSSGLVYSFFYRSW